MKNRLNRPDHDRFDVAFANRLAHLESFNKHLYRPNSYLHKWWARRCGSTFRMILKSFAGNPDEREYYAAGGLMGKIVLDPMLGGGTTLHEAIRLGANVVGYDVDPIPVLQARATLSDTSLKQLERGFQSLFDTIHNRMAPLYETRCERCGERHAARFVLYGLRMSCDCGESIFVDSLTIRREKDGDHAVLCPKCGRPTTERTGCSCFGDSETPKLYEKRVRRCPLCGRQFSELLDVPFYRRYRALVVAVNCQSQDLHFQAISQADQESMAKADALRPQLEFSGATNIMPGPKSDALLRRRIDDYRDLFSSRQLLYLKSAIDALKSAPTDPRLHLALLISTSLEFNVMLCGYKGSGVRRAGAVRHAFSHHAYSFPYTAVENNPVYDGLTSGGLRRLFRDRIQRARLWAEAPRERRLDGRGSRFVTIDGETDHGTAVDDLNLLQQGTHKFYVRQGTATELDLPDASVDLVVTDPPYYDSVQYGNLSAFFRVWLRQMLSDEAAGDIRWQYPMSDAAVDSGDGAADSHYLDTMSAIFGECRRVLKSEDGRLVFTFHHWKAAGWAAICLALKRSGFHLQEYYIVHAENPISVHIANMNALTHDAILVLANGTAVETPDWRQPARIDAESSAAFCGDCAEGVGWILNSSLGDEAVLEWWTDRLGAHTGPDNKRPPNDGD